MDKMTGIVYDAPREGLPPLAVVFGFDGEVLIAHAVSDRAEGEALLANIMDRVQARVDAEFGGEAEAA